MMNKTMLMCSTIAACLIGLQNIAAQTMNPSTNEHDAESAFIKRMLELDADMHSLFAVNKLSLVDRVVAYSAVKVELEILVWQLQLHDLAVSKLG